MAEQKKRGGKRPSKGRAGATRGALDDTVGRSSGAARETTRAVADAAPTDALEDVGSQGGEAAGGLLESTASQGDRLTPSRDQPSVRDELASIVREATIEILGPVARNATRQAARYAVKRGPQLVTQTIGPRVRDTLGPAIEEAGGPAELARGALSRASERRSGLLSKVGIGGDEDDGSSEPRIPVEQSIDVAVPLDVAYDQFNQFEEFSKFMSQGERVDERPNDRITWKSTDGIEGSAVITFHRLSDRLTRVMVTYDSQPHGLVEKVTSPLRNSRRALRSDLMRFKAYVEMTEVEEGADAGNQADVEDRTAPRRRSGARARATEEPEEDEDYDDESDDEFEPDEEPEQEEEEQPVARSRPARSRQPARPRQKARQRR